MLYKNNIVFYLLLCFFCQNVILIDAQAASISENSNASNGIVDKGNNHFHPQGKLPSIFTIKYQKEQAQKLPFEDKRDFEEAKRGFIAAPTYKTIMSEKGTVAWDMSSYDFLLTGQNFNSIHPSLSRQAILNMSYGLYEVLPNKIYQIRGFDLSNMTLIKSATGWILIDVLTSKETAKAALAFANEKLGTRPVVAVIYSHSHGDHFGGAHGVMNEADAKSGKIKVIAPFGFMEAAVSENIYAGNAMNRRMYYQYGLLLPRNPYGHVDQAIGKNVSSGTVGIIAPNYLIKKDFEKLIIDGVKLEFQNTPGTEAPAEMNIYFPDLRAFWAAENITSTVHNIYTLRGALVRDALEWSKHINESLYHYGNKARVMFSSHTWPRWGNNRIQEVMRAQRDVYANLNNGVLNLANKGVTINEIHNVYQPPKSLQNQWAARSYHGSVEHNSRAVINRYLGYWDSNPATLIPLSPKDSAPLYVEMMGGSQKILAKANQLFNEGKYLYAMEILNKLIYAQPQNLEAKYLLADVFEQIGYQKESTSLRNSFLAGALELRSGIPAGNVVKSLGSDLVSAMPTNLWLDYLAIRLNSEYAEGHHFIINLETPDNSEKYVIELSNASLTNIKGFQSEKANLSIKVNRTDLEDIIMGKSSFEEKINQGKITLVGDMNILKQLKGMIDNFSLDFEILPGTKVISSNFLR